MNTTKFMGHTYEWKNPFGNPTHKWSLIGPTMAVSFHVSINPQHGDTAGIENDCDEDTCCCADPAESHALRPCPLCTRFKELEADNA